MINLKHIILSCYNFPPNPGIGGRRWAKFAKHLAKKGYVIHVIRAKKKTENESDWTSDVQSENIIHYPIKTNYPALLGRAPKSIFENFLYRLQVFSMYLFTRGTIYDSAACMQHSYIRVILGIINKYNVKNIIVTGAPFRLFYYTALLKKNHPELNIICDYRDPWLNAVNYGFQNLSKNRRNFEHKMQSIVFEYCDIITAPNKFLLSEIKSFATNQQQKRLKFVEITHAYDDDIKQKVVKSKENKNKIILTYGGTLYIGTDTLLETLKSFLDLCKEKNSELYKRLEIRFYTNEIHFELLFNKHKDVVCFYKPVTNILEIIQISDFVLILLGQHNKDYLTTKFFELLPYRKPLIYIGERGYAADFIEKNKLGFILPSHFENELLNILKEFPLILKEYNDSFDYSSFSYQKMTKKLESYFI